MSNKYPLQKSLINKVCEKVYGKVYGNSNINKLKKLYSDPKIYTGGVNIDEWDNLPDIKQKEALRKSWYVYFSFRNPKTGLLERQNPIKAGNEYNTKRERMDVLESVRQPLLVALKSGFNPCEFKNESHQENIVSNNVLPKIDDINKSEIITAKSAIEVVLKIKKSELENTTYSRYKPRIEHFIHYLEDKEFIYKDIKSITKKHVLDYLDTIFEKTSAKTRNNTRSDLSSLFTGLEKRGNYSPEINRNGLFVNSF